MEIYEIVKKFPERKKRDRRWFTYEEAMLATQNNPYIQEAIRVSILNPAQYQQRVSTTSNTIQNSVDTAEENSDASLPTTPTNSYDTNTSSSATTTVEEKPNDAFHTLRLLMESTSISS